jgi:predicted ATPase
MRLAETGADVWFVDLAPVGDARDLAAAVCTVLGIRQHPEQDALATISQRLHGTHALLVLDNCEHLVDAAAELVENLLDACDGLSVLAASTMGTASPRPASPGLARESRAGMSVPLAFEHLTG